MKILKIIQKIKPRIYTFLVAPYLQKQPFRGVLRKGVLKISSKFTDHPCRSAISIKSQSNFIEIALWHECSPIYLLHIFRTHFPKNTFGWLLLYLRVVLLK